MTRSDHDQKKKKGEVPSSILDQYPPKLRNEILERLVIDLPDDLDKPKR